MASGYQTLATRDLPKGSKVDLWNAFGSETLSDMIVDPDDFEMFNARLSRLEVAEIGFVWMETNGATARRRSSEIGAWAAGAGEPFLLTVQEMGQSWLDHGGQSSGGGGLLPGDMILRNGSRPWVTRSCGRMSTVTLKIPRHLFQDRIRDPDRLAGHILSGNEAGVRMAASIILSIKRSLADMPEVGWNEAVADIVLETLSLACEQSGALQADLPSRDPVARGRWRDIGDYVERHLDDPDLSVGAIALATGQSVRSLQRFFVTAGKTSSRFILEKRLDRAAACLRDQGSAHRSITDIAFSVGFNELSYFSRAFADRFGMSPRAFRRCAG
jgi:AraC-like DNA-binding protein